METMYLVTLSSLREESRDTMAATVHICLESTLGGTLIAHNLGRSYDDQWGPEYASWSLIELPPQNLPLLHKLIKRIVVAHDQDSIVVSHITAQDWIGRNTNINGGVVTQPGVQATIGDPVPAGQQSPLPPQLQHWATRVVECEDCDRWYTGYYGDNDGDPGCAGCSACDADHCVCGEQHQSPVSEFGQTLVNRALKAAKALSNIN